MMKNLEYILKTIDYIEENLTEKIDYVELARIAHLSAYEFRRIFSFVIGYAPAEYIRKRRLSKSAMEIKAGEKVDENFAEKYGYNSVQSFLRAFKDYYGVPTQKILDSDFVLKSFNPPNIAFKLEQDTDLEYTLVDIEDNEIYSVSGLSDINDTVCCESVWNKFNELDQDYLMEISNDKKSYAVYENGERAIICNIGIKTDKTSELSDLKKFTIKGGKFLSFSCPMSATEEFINKLYETIRFRFLPSSPFVYDEKRPNVEIFPLDDGDAFTILIPIGLN